MFNCSSAITGRRAAAALVVALAWSCGDATPPQPAAPAAVATIDVAPLVQSLTVSGSATLIATVRDQSGAILPGRAVTWSSDIPTIASVDGSTGTVVALSGGTAVIAARSEGKTATAIVIVSEPVITLFIDSIAPLLYVGRTAQLVFEARNAFGKPIANRQVQWSTSAPSVATITSKGVLTGVSAGSATITGTVEGKSAARTIVVQAIPQLVFAVRPEAGTVARGTDLTLTPVVTDFEGKPISGHSVAYASSDPGIATVSATGVVRALSNGSVAIVATLDGQLQATSRLIVTDARTVAGVVVTADGGSPSNLQFTAQLGSGASVQRFSAPIDGVTGEFSLLMPALPAGTASSAYFVDAVSGTTRTYHATYASYSGQATPNGARILLIPHRIVPDSGTYAGRSLPVDLNEAFTAVCSNAGDANCQSYWPSYWLTGIKTWADASRPIPLAIDRTSGTVSAADSVALWTTIAQMEADLGRRLFAPAAFKGYTSTGYTTGMVLASRDASVAPFSGYTNWSWDATGTLYQARVRLASSQVFANVSTVSHEMTHALGFSHTCRWTTIMGGYGCAQQQRLGTGDVAYYHLAEQVRRQVMALRPTWSVAEAVAGARIIELGLPASSAIPLNIRLLLHKAGLPGSDGAP